MKGENGRWRGISIDLFQQETAARLAVLPKTFNSQDYGIALPPTLGATSPGKFRIRFLEYDTSNLWEFPIPHCYPFQGAWIMKTISPFLRAAGVAAVALFLTFSFSPPADAQIPGLPQVSPHAVAQQTIGITEVTVDYHRPAVRDRQVWGALVPYDTVWRAGANENTVIRFSDPVKVEGKDLAAGQYGLHMIPTEGAWTIIFSNNSTSWGSFTYDQAEDALRVEVTAQEAPFEEQLRYGFHDVDADSAVLSLYWAGRAVPVKIEADTHELVLAKIRRDLRSVPGFNAAGWSGAANYCLQNNINHEEALGWAERSIQMQDTFQGQWTRAGLLEQMGRADEARTARLAAVETGNEAQVNFAGYQMLQQGRIDEAIALFQENIERHPESWNVYDSLGEAYQNKGDTRRARELYSKALSMAPENQKPRINGILEQLQNS